MIPFSRSFFLLCLLSATLLYFSQSVNAERYSVKDDGFGNYTAHKEAYSEEDLAPKKNIKSENQKKSAPLSPSNEKAAKSKPVFVPSDQVESELIEKPKEKISIFEQKYLEAEAKAKAEILKNILNNHADRPIYDTSKVNSIDFVDGDELLKYGGRKENEKAPYYVTVDEYGRPTTVFYDPLLEKDVVDKQRQQSIEYTDALVYKRPAENAPGGLVLPEGADPVAAQILNSGKDELTEYFDSFTEHCCDLLPNRVIPNILLGKSHYFTLTHEDLPYRFHEGDSRYLLLELPAESNKNYPLRLRTFIREHKRKSIDHGVFFPQLITLDKGKKPLRIITGPLLRYHEETWASHGYLEGVFEIDRSKDVDERYILINTTRDALKQSSTIDADKAPITIKHMGIGSIEVQVLLEP